MLIHIREATPQDVDILIAIYERAYRGGYSACFDRYGPIGPEDFWWVQSEKSVSVVEVNREPAGLLVLGKDRTQMLVEELLLVAGSGTATAKIYEHLAGLFKKARQDRILLRAAETNTAALALAEEHEFSFVNALVAAAGAAHHDSTVSPGYTIRRATPEDARQVGRLTDELGVSPARMRRSKPKKDETQAFVWIAERDRYAAGFAEVRLRDGVGWWTAAVREGHRGKGVGAALAGAAVEFCRARHVKPITLYWALDSGAARLAQRLGAATERTYLYLQKKI